jgi:hypothetical protein
VCAKIMPKYSKTGIMWKKISEPFEQQYEIVTFIKDILKKICIQFYPKNGAKI